MVQIRDALRMNVWGEKWKRVLLFVGACLLLPPGTAWSQQTQVPECAARFTLKQEGVDRLAGSEKFAAMRGAISLDKDKTASLVLTLANRGKAEKFDVMIEPVGGAQVITGGGSRKVMVKSGASGTLVVAVKGTDVGERCDWRSRGLRATARSESVSTGKACATLEIRFFCPSQNKKTARM